MPHQDAGLLKMTVGLVANYVSHNRIDPEQVAALVQSVHHALSTVGQTAEAEEPQPERLTPAAIRKLITATGIKSLIDGREFKSIRRHIGLHGYSPKQYREHFGLPDDFPMVHPAYALRRSELAKSAGLGQGGRRPAKSGSAAAATAATSARNPPVAKA